MLPKNRLPFSVLSLTLCSVLLTAAPMLAADRLVPGQWEFALTTDGATHTSKHCVTPEEAASSNGTVQSARAAAEKGAARGHCTLKTFDIQGDTLTYALACGPRLIESTATFHGDSSDGTLTTTFEGKAVVTKVKAKRLGAC